MNVWMFFVNSRPGDLWDFPADTFVNKLGTRVVAALNKHSIDDRSLVSGRQASLFASPGEVTHAGLYVLA